MAPDLSGFYLLMPQSSHLWGSSSRAEMGLRGLCPEMLRWMGNFKGSLDQGGKNLTHSNLAVIALKPKLI